MTICSTIGSDRFSTECNLGDMQLHVLFTPNNTFEFNQILFDIHQICSSEAAVLWYFTCVPEYSTLGNGNRALICGLNDVDASVCCVDSSIGFAVTSVYGVVFDHVITCGGGTSKLLTLIDNVTAFTIDMESNTSL